MQGHKGEEDGGVFLMAAGVVSIGDFEVDFAVLKG
ncbi:hypothetical protein MEA186_09555 [Mesorhizobium amorphae CCNWGS0123]|uniref:Uncharacterized protein n=1 Tax=Mesorhizobium amorphae CCNWGS0123 TaxID=1082933 RepID=G6Y7J5_9HYPH|nr:hypothetical protein MEA186_09555 [Mesorhizobium amorphae CCNWGS0123]